MCYNKDMASANPIPQLQAIAANRWYGNPDESPMWHRKRYVVLKRYNNGWHVGFCNDTVSAGDEYWHSGVSQEAATRCFEMAAVPDCTVDGFNPEYVVYCRQRGLDPESVASVAKFGCFLDAGNRDDGNCDGEICDDHS